MDGQSKRHLKDCLQQSKIVSDSIDACCQYVHRPMLQMQDHFFPVLSSSHHYPSMVGALLCFTVSFLSWPIKLIAVTQPLVKYDS